MNRTIDRYVALLETLPHSGKRSTTEIAGRLAARGFETYPRMVQRDLQALARSFPIECDTRSKPYGWRWRPDARPLHLPAMSSAQALSFQLVHAYLRDLFPAQVLDELKGYFDASRRRLDEVADRTPLGRWPARVHVHAPEMPLKPVRIRPAVHAAVTDALLLGRQVEIRHLRKGGGEEATHRIHPLGLIQSGRVLYLAARYYEYPDVRLVALHRIARAQVLEAPAEAPASFTLAGFVASGVLGFGGSGAPLRVRLAFRDGAGDHLLESPLADDQQVARGADGTLQVTATVQDTERLRWWLLGFGACVTVLGPPALRRDVAGRLRAAVHHYDTKATRP